jgi:signal transduction histidine kinase
MRAHLPFLNPGIHDHDDHRGGDDLDQLALLRASQTIASERSLPRLVARVTSLVGELTGATDVQFLLLDETDSWQLEGGLRGSEVLMRSTREVAEAQRTIAASVLRLGLKTQVPMVSDDAVIDSRFIGDPHFANLSLCSLLALPVMVRDRVGAFLILEHRLFRAAFTTALVETATMLCRQLAVSIENARLYQSLEARITEREQELKCVYERLTTIEVEGARMAERERLIQDMHDGFGSQLASARLRIDHGEITQGDLAALLRECLDDLNLVVDTLGNEDKSLRDALADYRYRCNGRLSEYPVRIEWEIQLDTSPPMDQRQILQCLRILQESLNNALKHAHASLIRLQVVYCSDGVLTMSVTDDGVGLPQTIECGRGLNNMQSRARDIGATLQYDRLDPGTRISLFLPLGRTSESGLQESILPGP